MLILSEEVNSGPSLSVWKYTVKCIYEPELSSDICGGSFEEMSTNGMLRSWKVMWHALSI